MKTIKTLSFIFLVATLVFSCTKEPPSIGGFSATVDNTDVDAGSQVTFTINKGDAEFVTFYSGRPGSVFANYPIDKGQQLDLQFSSEYKTTYNDQGQYVATIVAVTYGNWGEDSKQTFREFTINVTDNRTGIVSFMVKLTLFVQIKAEINEESHTIKVNFPSGFTNLTQRSTIFVLESAGAKAYKADNTELVSGTKIDFTEDFTIKVVAPGGDEQVWTVVPTVAP